MQSLNRQKHGTTQIVSVPSKASAGVAAISFLVALQQVLAPLFRQVAPTLLVFVYEIETNKKRLLNRCEGLSGHSEGGGKHVYTTGTVDK